MSEEQFEKVHARWAKECAEWAAISKEMIEAGKEPSAYDVTAEQRRRMTARGEKLCSEDKDACELLGLDWPNPHTPS